MPTPKDIVNDLRETPVSINEPPGSHINHPVAPDATKTQPAPNEAADVDEPLPSEAELWKMTRHDLFELAAERAVKVEHSYNKEEVIHALVRAEKKNKRR